MSLSHNAQTNAQTRSGLVSALGCYTLWGFLPLYWDWLKHVSYFEVVGQRILWCFVFLFLVGRFVQKQRFFNLLRNRRSLALLGGCALMVTATWCLYIWGVMSGMVIEVALGYYLTPLGMILGGTLFFKERLTFVQKLATALVLLSVAYLSWDYGRVPWLAIALAMLFGVYSSLKKLGGYAPVQGLTAESALALPLALVAVVASFWLPERAFFAPHQTEATLLLIGGGVVTAVPFLLFAQAANKAPLSLIGFVQYLEPTISLLLGIFYFGEEFTLPHLISFAVIWLGLLLVSAELFYALRRRE